MQVLMTTLWISVTNVRSKLAEKEISQNITVTEQIERNFEDGPLCCEKVVGLAKYNCTSATVHDNVGKVSTNKDKYHKKSDSSSVINNSTSTVNRQNRLEKNPVLAVRKSTKGKQILCRHMNIADGESCSKHIDPEICKSTDKSLEYMIVNTANNNGFSTKSKSTKESFCSSYASVLNGKDDSAVLQKSQSEKKIEDAHRDSQCIELVEIVNSEKNLLEMECDLKCEAVDEIFAVTNRESGQVPFKITNVTGNFDLFEDVTKNRSGHDEKLKLNEVIIELDMETNDEFVNKGICKENQITMSKMSGRINDTNGQQTEQHILDENKKLSCSLTDENCTWIKNTIEDHNRVFVTGSGSEPAKPLILMTNIHNSIKRKAKRQLSAYNLELKYMVVTALENGEKAASLAKKYNIKSNTISDWKRVTDKIKSEYESGDFRSTRKKMREATYKNIEAAVLKWMNMAKSENIVVNSPLLVAKAEDLARELRYDGWKASSGWIDRFKKRHGIVFTSMSRPELC